MCRASGKCSEQSHMQSHAMPENQQYLCDGLTTVAAVCAQLLQATLMVAHRTVANYRGIGMDHRIAHSQNSHIEQIWQVTF